MSESLPWSEDPSDECEVCGHLLCDGSCEKQVDSQLIAAGMGGVLFLLALLVLRWVLT